jgi:hypothetical protein
VRYECSGSRGEDFSEKQINGGDAWHHRADEPSTNGEQSVCTRMYAKSRVVPDVPKYRAIMLDGGDIKRQMFVDWKDERLNTWKPNPRAQS